MTKTFKGAMREWCERAAFRVGSWLLRQSNGFGASEWTRMERDVIVAQQWGISADAKRRAADARYRRTMEVVRLADGLLSGDNPRRAQEQLRLAIIADTKTTGRSPADTEERDT